MPTTTSELQVARSWIGTVEADDDFNERFDRHYLEQAGLGSNETEKRTEALNLAIDESLRSQLASMTLDQPGSASAEGLSYANNQNMITLQQMLKLFEQQSGVGGTGRFSHMVRYIQR